MMFILTQEQLEVGSVASKFLDQQLPITKLRAFADAAESATTGLAIDEDVWRRSAELGWFGLGVSESLGGVGCGPVEEIMLFTELGRSLAPGPYVSTVIAGWVASTTGATQLAADIFSGRRRAGLETGEFIVDGELGGLVVRFEGSVCEVREIMQLDRVASVDPSVGLARGVLGPVIVQIDDALVNARAQLLVSAMELGISLAVLDMSVGYGIARHQFGKPIGTFQAVKHRCADMAIRSHASRAQTLFAGLHVAGRTDDAVFQSAAAKSVSTKAAKLNTVDNVQNHGAIGFTLEHDAGLFARRAHMLEFALGGEVAAVPALLAVDRHRFETLPARVEPWFSPMLNA